MDRHQTSCFTCCDTVRPDRTSPFHLLLRRKASERPRSDSITAHRRTLYRKALPRLQDNHREAKENGASGQSKTGSGTHERAWTGWVSTGAQYFQTSPGTHKIPLSTKRHGNQTSYAGVELRHHVHPFARRLCLPDSRHRLVQPTGALPPSLEQPRWQLLHRSLRRGDSLLWEAGDLQYRSRGTVFLKGVRQCGIEQKHSVQHGRQRKSPRQYLRGTTMEVSEV